MRRAGGRISLAWTAAATASLLLAGLAWQWNARRAASRDDREIERRSRRVDGLLRSGASQGSAVDVRDALVVASEGRRLHPQLPSAWRDFARALEAFHLWEQARLAWRQVLELEPDTYLAREAEDGLAALPAPEGGRWAELCAEIRRAAEEVDLELLRTWAGESPELLFEVGADRLLAEWAEGNSGSGSDGSLAAAATIGSALAGTTGDRMLAEVVGPVLAAAGPEREAWRTALLPLVRARAAVRERRYADAEPWLAAAEVTLAGRPTPARRWIAYGRARVAYQDDRYDEADEHCEEVARDDFALVGPLLVADCRRLQGLMLRLRGRFEGALARYEQALALTRDRFPEATANHEVSAAIVEDLLGEEAPSWQRLVRALGERRRFSSPAREYLLVVEPGRRLKDAEPRAASPFYEEALAVAAGSGDPVVEVDALQEMADLQAHLGQLDQALERLGEAGEVARTIADASVRSSQELDNLRFRGRALAAAKDWQAAREALDRVVAQAAGIGYGQILPEVLLERAKILRALGDTPAARRDVERAAADLEARHVELAVPAKRLALVLTAREVFDEWVSLVLMDGEVDVAFGLAERWRRLAFAAGDRRATSAGELARVASRLPPERGLLVFWTGVEESVVWAVSAGGTASARLPWGRDELSEKVESFRRQLGTGGGAELEAALETAYRDLLGPVAGTLAGTKTWTIVPSPELATLPLAALRDPALDGYLVEQVAMAMAPSVASVLGEGPSWGPRGALPLRLVAVGDPRREGEGFDRLPELPRARQEMAGLEGLYEDPSQPGSEARTWTGAEARLEVVLPALETADVVHLASHTVPDRTSPWGAELPLAGGRSPATALAEALAGSPVQLLVLAACDSAVGRRGERQGLFNLAALFLASGVPTVVATLRPVEDGATAELMHDFHERYRAGAPAADALRQAQLDRIRSDPDGDPWSWAAFAVLGDPGG